jgi:hypothetical protein
MKKIIATTALAIMIGWPLSAAADHFQSGNDLVDGVEGI